MLALVVTSGVVWAISSEPVYIKGPENIQAFKERLEKLQKLVRANDELFAGQGDLKDILDTEVSRFAGFKLGADPGRIEVTKIYRSLDTVGKMLGAKRTAAVNDVQATLRSQLDWIEQQNNLKGIVRGW